MASPVEIFNSALIKLVVEPIQSFSDDSKQARIGNEQFNKIRDKLLASHYWNFAMKRSAELAVVSASPPEFGFSLKYQLPVDVIRVMHLNVKTARFKVEQNRFLHTNVSGAKILYVAKEADVSKYSPMFSELLALELAIDTCMALTQKRTLRADLVIDRKDAIRDARSADGQEGTNDELMSDVWLNARVSGPTGDFLFDESV